MTVPFHFHLAALPKPGRLSSFPFLLLLPSSCSRCTGGYGAGLEAFLRNVFAAFFADAEGPVVDPGKSFLDFSDELSFPSRIRRRKLRSVSRLARSVGSGKESRSLVIPVTVFSASPGGLLNVRSRAPGNT